MEPAYPTPLDDYLFDLRGYVVIKNAAEPELVDELNRAIDTIPPLEYGEWYGNTQRRDYTASTGLELHNCVELGGPFETMIDYPGWINYVRHYCGEEKSYVEGLFIDECILSVRGPSGITRSTPVATRAPCAALTTTPTACSAVDSATSSWRSPTLAPATGRLW